MNDLSPPSASPSTKSSASRLTFKRPSFTDRTRRIAIWTASGTLLLFWLWVGWPYFHSIVVRDAAVTSWLNVVTAPIDGEIDPDLPATGAILGPEGRAATIRNPRADHTALERVLGELAVAEARIAHAREAKAFRGALAARYAEAFQNQLDLQIEHDEARLAFLGQQLATERADTARLHLLRESGGASPSAAEAAAARLAALESERVALESVLHRARLRRDAANRGIFLLENGAPADWEGHFDALRAAGELAEAEAAQTAAELVANVARRDFTARHEAALVTTPGAVVWRRYAAPGAAVRAGDPVLGCIDPGVLLVDVPVSDVEAALLRPGDRADVILEGENCVRRGVVLLTRGSSSLLGERDLAAVTQRRSAVLGQVIVQLESTPEDQLKSPVGLGADVDFPGVGVLSILRARLRL